MAHFERAAAEDIRSNQSTMVESNRERKDAQQPGAQRDESAQTVLNTQLARGAQVSKFQEVNRDSALFGRIPIGQRVRVNSRGHFSPDPSPDSEVENPITTPDADDHFPDSMARDADVESPSSRQMPVASSPKSGDPRSSTEQASRPEPVGEAAKLLPMKETSRLPDDERKLHELLDDLQALNGLIEREQQQARRDTVTCQGVLGWVVIGTGLGHLVGAKRIEGHSREDILWENVGVKEQTRVFNIKIVLLTFFVAVISKSCRERRADLSGTFLGSDYRNCARICSSSGLLTSHCYVGRIWFRGC